MKINKKNIVIVFFLISLIVLPSISSAQLKTDKLEGTNLSQTFFGCGTTSKVTCIVENILKFILALAFFVAAVYIVISGYRMVVSSGNEEAVTAAKKNLYWALAGIIVIALSWAILTFVVDIAINAQPGR